VLRFGIALWPYDLLLRFAWDLPEHEHVWPDEWFDDVFEHAARDLRSLAPKLITALSAMIVPMDALKNAAINNELTRDLTADAPLHVDLVLAYLARLLDHVATIIPHCYGQSGQALADGRGNLRRLVEMPLEQIDPELPALLTPDGALPPEVELTASPSGAVSMNDGDVATHTQDLYAIINSPGFDAALPKATAHALRASADVTIAAADRVDAALPGLCDWLDRLLEHLIVRVCDRADEGDDLAERWRDSNWTVLQPLGFTDTDAALALIRALPTVAEGPDLALDDDPGADD